MFWFSQIKIVANGENKNVTNSGQETWSGYYAGVSLAKETKGMNFDLDLIYLNAQNKDLKPLEYFGY